MWEELTLTSESRNNVNIWKKKFKKLRLKLVNFHCVDDRMMQ